MTAEGIISQKQKYEIATHGKYLIGKRVGFPHEGFYIVKVIETDPLRVQVHTTLGLNWNRDWFRVAWQETLQYQKDAVAFLQKMQNTTHVLTGLTEFGACNNAFKDLALCILYWL